MYNRAMVRLYMLNRIMARMRSLGTHRFNAINYQVINRL